MQNKDRWTVVPAVYILLNKNSKILLLHRAEHDYYMGGFFSLPSGHLEGGESMKQAAVRETKEEVGISINPEDLRLVHVLHRVAEEGDHERIDFFFATDRWSGEAYNAEPDKCQGIQWTAQTDLPANTVPVVRFVLEKIQAGVIYSEYNFS